MSRSYRKQVDQGRNPEVSLLSCDSVGIDHIVTSSPFGPRTRVPGSNADRESQTDGFLPDLPELFPIDPPSGSDDFVLPDMPSTDVDPPFFPDDIIPENQGDQAMPEM